MDLTIRTDNGVACLYQGSPVGRRAPFKEVADSALASELSQKGFLTSGLLPPAVRWISASGRQAIFERPPQHQTIRFTDTAAGNVSGHPELQYEFTLPLPWTIYAVTLNWGYHISNLKVYVAQHSLATANDRLWTLPVPNVWDAGQYCLPPMGRRPDACLATGLEQAYEAVWSSGFNRDIIVMPEIANRHAAPAAIFVQSATPRISAIAGFYSRWERASLKDIVEAGDWPTPQSTVAEVIAGLAAYEEQLLSALTLTSTIVQAATALRPQDAIVSAV